MQSIFTRFLRQKTTANKIVSDLDFARDEKVSDLDLDWIEFFGLQSVLDFIGFQVSRKGTVAGCRSIHVDTGHERKSKPNRNNIMKKEPLM